MKMRILIASTLLALMLVPSASTFAQSGGDFVIVKSTIDGGGGTSSGGDFVLSGTIGQPDASVETSRGGDFALAGGFWAMVEEIMDLIFFDSFETD